MRYLAQRPAIAFCWEYKVDSSFYSNSDSDSCGVPIGTPQLYQTGYIRTCSTIVRRKKLKAEIRIVLNTCKSTLESSSRKLALEFSLPCCLLCPLKEADMRRRVSSFINGAFAVVATRFRLHYRRSLNGCHRCACWGIKTRLSLGH